MVFEKPMTDDKSIDDEDKETRDMVEWTFICKKCGGMMFKSSEFEGKLWCTGCGRYVPNNPNDARFRKEVDVYWNYRGLRR